MEKDNYREELIQAYKSKSLWKKITQIYLDEIRSDPKNLPTILAEIHNEKLFDLNELYKHLDIENNERIFLFYSMFIH